MSRIGQNNFQKEVMSYESSNEQPYSPFGELDQTENEMNRLFVVGLADGRRTENPTAPRHGLRWPTSTKQTRPLFSIRNCPVVDPKSVDIRLENNVLTLKGERQFDYHEGIISTLE
jgi:hypothetical protein